MQIMWLQAYSKTPRNKPSIKCQALHLYLERLGFRSIGRFLNCSHVTVYNWIKAYSESIEPQRSDKNIDIVELGEIHTYIGSKKTIVGPGLLLIEMGRFPPLQSGFLRHNNRVEVIESYQGQKHKNVTSNYWSPYENFSQKKYILNQKLKPNTVKGCNSLFRHYLARLRRKSKCYSKNKDIQLCF